MSKNQSMKLKKLDTAAFTTLLYLDGEFLHLASHMERLFRGADYLFPKVYGFDDLKSILECFYELKLGSDSYKVKIILYENNFNIETEKIMVKSIGIVELGLSEKIKKYSKNPSFLKTGNYSTFFLDLNKNKKRRGNENLDELIYLSSEGFICDSTVSNIFLIDSRGNWFTSKTSSVVLEGIIRNKFINFLNKIKIKVCEKNITREDLFNSKVIILTNSIRGVRVASRVEAKLFKTPKKIFKIIDQFGRYGERCE